MGDISPPPADRILRKAGAPRVSEEAAQAFAAALDNVAASMAEKAVRLAKHAGRKTVKAQDVRMALK